MPDVCCAVGCRSRRGEKEGQAFYRIPADKDRRQAWINAIKREGSPVHGEKKVEGSGQTPAGKRKKKDWQPSKYTRLCSDHFILGK